MSKRDYCISKSQCKIVSHFNDDLLQQSKTFWRPKCFRVFFLHYKCIIFNIMFLDFSVSACTPKDVFLFNFTQVMRPSGISIYSSGLPTWQSDIYFREGVSVYQANEIIYDEVLSRWTENTVSCYSLIRSLSYLSSSVSSS